MRRGPLLLAALLVAVGVAWAVSRGGMLDDAFISFRYARNLAAGHGLVYNPGEFVEGYTNFLWTLLMSFAFLLDIDVVHFATWLGFSFYVLALALVAGLSLRWSREDGDGPRWLPLALLATLTNPTVRAFASGGLETSLFTSLLLLLAVSTHAALTGGGAAAAGLASLTAALLTLTRPDGALLLVVFLGAGTVQAVLRRTGREIFAWTLPAAAVVGGFLTWRLWYYGELVPNTYYAKNAQLSHWAQGIAYLRAFVGSYPLLVLTPAALAILLLGGSWLRLPPARRCFGITLGLALAAFTSYVVKVGGDFMEYRFFAPVLPLAFLLLELTARSLPRPRWCTGVLCLCLVLSHLLLPVRVLPEGKMETVEEMHAHLREEAWDRTGLWLGRRLPADTVLATTAGGAIPFYANLTTIDLLGLTDARVARLDMDISRQGATIGHCKFAPDSYLRERGVHLVLAWPGAPEWFPDAFPAPGEVILRLWGDRAVRLRYLCESAALTARFRGRPEYKYLARPLPVARSIVPPPLSGNRRLLDTLDVGDPVSERSHGLEVLEPRIEARGVDRFGFEMEDDGRLVRSTLHLRLPQAASGRGTTLLLRAHRARPLDLSVRCGRMERLWRAPATQPGFDYLAVDLPASSDVTLTPRNGSVLPLFQVWVLTGAGVPD